MRSLRWVARSAALSAATVVVVAVASPPAFAVPGVELGFALAETNVAIGLAAVEVAKANAANPNVTCSMPVVHGGNVNPAVGTPAATVNGQDVAAAEGECVSLTGQPFTATLQLFVEYRGPNGGWGSYCASSASMSSIDGVAVVSTAAHCFYAPDHPAAGRPHRAYAVLTTSVSGPYPGYSEPWQG